MTRDEQRFFKALGSRIANLRQEAGLSQQAMADQLGIPQQTYANYEVARARPSAAMLPEIARLFGISVDELLGIKNSASKRGPAPKIQRQLERINQLPRSKQKFVMEMLETVIQQQSASH